MKYNLNLLKKFPISSRNTQFKDILPWNINQHESSQKLCNETGHPIVNMMESQWKLRQQHDQNFQLGGSHCRTNTSVRRNK